MVEYFERLQKPVPRFDEQSSGIMGLSLLCSQERLFGKEEGHLDRGDHRTGPLPRLPNWRHQEGLDVPSHKIALPKALDEGFKAVYDGGQVVHELARIPPAHLFDLPMGDPPCPEDGEACAEPPAQDCAGEANPCVTLDARQRGQAKAERGSDCCCGPKAYGVRVDAHGCTLAKASSRHH